MRQRSGSHGSKLGNRVSCVHGVVLVLAVACGGKSTDEGALRGGDGKKQRDVDAGGSGAAPKGDGGSSKPDASDTAGQSSSDAPAQANGGDPSGASDDVGGGGVGSDGGGDDGIGSTPGDGTGSVTGPDESALPQFDCSAAPQQFDRENMKPYHVTDEVADAVQLTLQAMDPAAKATQLMGIDGTARNYRDIYRSVDVDVPGIGTVRGFRYRDAGRGVSLDSGQDNRVSDHLDYSTSFPTPALRAASWDLALERRVGAAIGDETAASMNNVLLAPVAGLVRHPYWGRAQEAYGEDPYSAGRMATAFSVGAQQFVLTCAKHFAGNDVEKKRSLMMATLTEQALREVYARPFEMLVRDGGVGCVMAAYNLVNQTKATQNEHLLTEILKAPESDGGMGFEGFVISDWWAMPGEQKWPDYETAQAVTNEALTAGLDVEVPWSLNYNATTLASADPAQVEAAARRVLTQKYRFNTALTSDGWSLKAPTSTLTDGSITPNEEHEALAEEAAIKSIVLLTNGLDSNSAVLPLNGATTVAVIGPDQLFSQISSSVPKSCAINPDVSQGTVSGRECTFRFATDPALGDRGSSRVNADPERSFGPFAGIQSAAGSEAAVTSGSSAEAAASADAIVVVVGYTPGDEGEEYYIAAGGDRSSLDLPPGHNDFVQSVLDLDKPTVIVVESGSIVNLPWLSHPNQQQATIWAGYPGMRGGLALGKLIFGQANFSGKLPMAWPTEAALPVFKDTETTATLGYSFGYREFDRRRFVEGAADELVFPFGHGSSYSSFEYSNLTLPCSSVKKDAVVNVTVDIENASELDGDEVAMLFVKPPPTPSSVGGERPWKELKSFARVSVPAGQSVTAALPLRIADLRRWEGAEDGRWIVDSGEYTILVGKNADDAETATTVGSVMVEGD